MSQKGGIRGQGQSKPQKVGSLSSSKLVDQAHPIVSGFAEIGSCVATPLPLIAGSKIGARGSYPGASR